MTEPTDNSRISATLKGGPGFDAPWVVVRANSASEINDALMDLDASGTYPAVADSAVTFQNAYIKATPGSQAAPAAVSNPARPPLTANTQAPSQGSPDEIILKVEYDDRNAVKALGARWNAGISNPKPGKPDNKGAWTVKPRFEKDYLTKFQAYL